MLHRWVRYLLFKSVWLKKLLAFTHALQMPLTADTPRYRTDPERSFLPSLHL